MTIEILSEKHFEDEEIYKYCNKSPMNIILCVIQLYYEEGVNQRTNNDLKILW